MKFVLQAAAAVSASAFALVAANNNSEKESKMMTNTNGAASDTLLSSSAAIETSEAKGSRRFLVVCADCHLNAPTTTIAHVGRVLGGTGAACPMEDGQFAMSTKEDLDACCNHKSLSSNGQAWTVGSLAEFLQSDSQHHLPKETSTSIAENLESLCQSGKIAKGTSTIVDNIVNNEATIEDTPEGDEDASTTMDYSTNDATMAKANGSVGAGLALFSTMAFLQLAKRN